MWTYASNTQASRILGQLEDVQPWELQLNSPNLDLEKTTFYDIRNKLSFSKTKTNCKAIGQPDDGVKTSLIHFLLWTFICRTRRQQGSFAFCSFFWHNKERSYLHGVSTPSLIWPTGLGRVHLRREHPKGHTDILLSFYSFMLWVPTSWQHVFCTSDRLVLFVNMSTQNVNICSSCFLKIMSQDSLRFLWTRMLLVTQVDTSVRLWRWETSRNKPQRRASDLSTSESEKA